MDTQEEYCIDNIGAELSPIRPVLSTRRRLQNREAQRRYREKAAQKRSWDGGPISLWDFSPDAKSDHGDMGFTTDLDEEQAWLVESPNLSASPSSRSASSFSPANGGLPIEDASLMLDLDVMNTHHSGSIIPAQGQYPMPSQHMHPPPLPLMGLYHSSFTGDFQYSVSQEPPPVIAQKCNPAEPLLHVAVRSRSRNMIAMLLRRGAAAVGDRNSDGITALHIATELGDEATVSLLLHHGADVGVRDSQGRDPLHLAVSAGQTAIVELMLDKCKINSRNS